MNLLNILSAQKELDTYLDSIQGRIDLFNNALQTMWMNLISSDVVKGVVDIGTVLVKFLDTAIGKATVLFGLFKGFSLYGQFKASGQESLFDFILGGAKEGLGKVKDLSGISNLASVFKDAFYNELAKQKGGTSAIDLLAGLAGFNDTDGILGDFIKKLGIDEDNLSSKFITKEQAAEVLDSFDDISDATKTAILDSDLFATAQTGAAGATNILSAANARLIAILNGLKAAFMSLWTNHPYLMAFAGIALAVTAVTAAYKKFGPTHENALKKLESETEGLKSVQDELKSVNNELESVQKSMAELESKDKLSFVEEQELERLKSISAELERQQRILEAQEKRKQEKQIEAAVDAAKKDANLQGYNAQANVVAATTTGAPVYAASLQTAQDDETVNQFESNLNALASAQERFNEAQKELDEYNEAGGEDPFRLKALEKAVDDAEVLVDKANTSLDSMSADWQANYGDIGFISKEGDEELTDVEKQWNDIYRAYQDAMDKQALLNKDITKADVLERVFGKTGTDAAQAFKKEFVSAFKRGEDPSEIIAQALENSDYAKVFNNILKKFGISTDDIVNYFTQYGDSIVSDSSIVETKTYSALASKLESINDVHKQTQEILTNGTTVTQEYKDALIDLVGSEEKVNECFVDGSGLVVKNADGLEDLLKVSKKNIANQAKLAKTQARLRYAELYKEMQKVRNGETELNQATKDRINAIYKEMSALQSSIAKYSMLEHKLLGAANAYERLAEAQEIDAANDYGTKAEELVNVLGAAFKTAKLGTESAKVAIGGLIPDEVIDKSKTFDEQMEQIHKYFTEGEVSKLFTIKYEEDGSISGVDMTRENIKNFTTSLMSKELEGGAGTVFQGTWDEFTLNPAITSLEDFAKACGTTEEVAFAYLTELESYTIDWLGGDDSTFLDQLMGDDFEYRAHKVTSEMADLEHQFANGKISVDEYRTKMEGLDYQLQSQSITQEEYDTKVADLDAKLKDGTITIEEYTKALKGLNGVQNLNNKKIKDNVVSWAEANQEVINSKAELERATKELEGMNKSDSGATDDEIALKTKEVQELSKKLSDALVKKYNLQEPTEMTIQIALDEANAQIEQFKADNAVLLTKVKIVQDEEGNYSYTVNPDIKLDNKEIQNMDNYINMLNEQYVLSVMADEDPNDAVAELESCKTAAEAANKAIKNISDPDINAQSAIDEINRLIGTINSIPDAVITATVSIAQANGNAEVFGNAYAGGTWGAKNTETALTGELGKELIVRGNKWFTVGDNGAEFAQIKKGDIIFNHRQTEEILKNGHITGRGKMVGGAFARGNAYASGLQKYSEVFSQYDKNSSDASEFEQLVNHIVILLADLLYEFEFTLEELIAKLYGFNSKEELDGALPDEIYYTDLNSPKFVHTTGRGRYAMLHGNAFADGDNGVPRTETALMAELGPEILVRGNQWTTIGDDGPCFTQVKKGDVIFNHKQTAELLKNGHTSSRGKIKGGHSAFAHGTAYAFAIHSDSYQDEQYKNSFRKTVREIVDSAKDVGTEIIQEFFGEPTPSRSASSSSSSSSSNNGTTSGTHGNTWDDAATDTNTDKDDGGGKGKDDDKDKETFDWIEVKLEEINEKIGLTEAKLENASNLTEQNSTIDKLISIHQDLYDNLTAASDAYHAHAETLLAKIPEEYRQIAQDGTIKLDDGAIDLEDFAGEERKKILESIQEYREWVQKAADVTQQAEETITTLRDLAIQQFDNAREAGELKIAIEDSQIEKLQNAVDFDEARGEITSDAYYAAMMKEVNDKIKLLTETKNNMQKEFNDLMKIDGFVGSNQYYEKLNEMYEIDSEIANARIELEEFQNAINDISTENFDQLIARLGYIKNDTQNLIDLMSDEDMFVKPEGKTMEGGTVEFWDAEDVTWTDEGLATMGLYVQQMEIAQAGADACAKRLQELKEAYDAGNISENEYLELTDEINGQIIDYNKTVQDSKKAIHDLNSERIDYVKEGIQKEIEAYEELIETKKENLREDKNSRDYKRSVSDKQREIDDIKMQIAALSNNHSAQARAKLANLQAELAEKEQDLEDLYYDHSLEVQEKAYDDSLESFKNGKEAELEELDKYLEDVKKVVADSLVVVKANADAIGATLTEKTEEYSLTVSDAVLAPWKDGASAISAYQEAFNTATSSTTAKLNAIRDAWQEVINKTKEAGDANVAQINKENAAYVTAGTKQATTTTNIPKTTASSGGTYTVKRGDTLWGIAAAKLGSGARWQEIYNLNKNIISNPDLIQPGWKLKLPKYAKGTTGVKNDQLAIIDELGEELQLVPDGNGRLAYMTKGTSIIPHDITENLMTLGQLDPQDIIDRNRPVIGAPHVSTNETVISIEYGDILHIDNYSGDKPENLSKLIDKAFDKHMKDLNQQIRRFTR